MILRINHLDRVMDMRIEQRNFLRDRFQTQFLQRLKEALVDQLHSARIFLIGSFHFKRALEVVEYRQHGFDCVHSSELKEATTLTLYAAAIILKFRLPAPQPVLK